jgi:hypothetical protein
MASGTVFLGDVTGKWGEEPFSQWAQSPGCLPGWTDATPETEDCVNFTHQGPCEPNIEASVTQDSDIPGQGTNGLWMVQPYLSPAPCCPLLFSLLWTSENQPYFPVHFFSIFKKSLAYCSCTGYTVTFTKLLTIFLKSTFSTYPYPFLRTVSTGLIVPFSYMST